MRDVDHDVPHHDDLARHPLEPQRLGRALGRAQQQRRRMVGQHAVELLRHRPVVGAHPGLDVRDRHPGLRARHGARQGRVGVAVDQHHVRPLGRQQRLQRGQHARGLRGVGAAPDAEPMVRPRQSQLVEEHPRQLVVVVLAGVDEHLMRARPQPVGDGGRLHELRPVAYDRDDTQAATPRRSPARARSAAPGARRTRSSPARAPQAARCRRRPRSASPRAPWKR